MKVAAVVSTKGGPGKATVGANLGAFWLRSARESGKQMETFKMINLRLANEYLAGPVFCPDLDQMGHVDIEDLPVSRSLSDKIRMWDDEYQSTFNDEYPPDSGFCSPQEKVRHVNEGCLLAQEMQAELGDSYKIEYCP
jgi:hypothetical protein